MPELDKYVPTEDPVWERKTPAVTQRQPTLSYKKTVYANTVALSRHDCYNIYMGLSKKILSLGILTLICGPFVAQTTEPNIWTGGTSSLPPELRRPRHGEEPRFPQDYVIGRLGRCDAPEESYRQARLLTASIAAGNGKTEEVFFPEQKRLSALESLSGIGTRNWRVGGGKIEPDGSVSFLIRFLGREKSITGELYLRRDESAAKRGEENPAWQVDDVLLENPRSLAEGKFSPGGADMAPYERFF